MYNNKKIVATIEARMTSSRLPGKVLMKLCGKPVLLHIIERLKRSNYVDEVVVATTVNDTDKPIINLCEDFDCKYYRGSEEDVLLRVLDAAKSVDADIIVEITGDCPIIDWRIMDELIELFFSGDYDYTSNIIERTFPRGLDTQVFPASVLEKVNKCTKESADREHVSLFIYRNPKMFRLKNLKAPSALNHPKFEITLDTKEDYDLIKNIYNELYCDSADFTARDVVSLLLEKPELLDDISKIQRKSV